MKCPVLATPSSWKKACLQATLFLTGMAWCAQATDWPQWLGPERDSVWREDGVPHQFPEGGPKQRWRTPIGSGYSGPAVSQGRVFVMDRKTEGPEDTNRQAFQRGIISGQEGVVCLKETTGEILWRHDYPATYNISYPAGPRVTPTVEGDRVYSLGAEGALFCLNAKNGDIIWSRDLKLDYRTESPLWGFAAHPLIDGPRLICLVGGKDSLVVAFDKHTGRELWRSLSSTETGYSPPVIQAIQGRKQLIIWHPRSLNGLDPQTGRLLWTEPFQVKAGLTAPTPRVHGNHVFVTSFYNGPLMLEIEGNPPHSKVTWRGKGRNERNTDGLHSIMCTPFIEDGHIYGVGSYGQLRCLEMATGRRIWETFEATGGVENRWANAFLIKHEDAFFIPNEKGDLIIAQLTPEGYKELDRFHMIEPDNHEPRRAVNWSHPAFANGCVFARNDHEIVCYSLTGKP